MKDINILDNWYNSSIKKKAANFDRGNRSLNAQVSQELPSLLLLLLLVAPAGVA